MAKITGQTRTACSYSLSVSTCMEITSTAVSPIALPTPYPGPSHTPLQCATAETSKSCLTSKSKDILVGHDGQTLIKNLNNPDRKGPKSNEQSDHTRAQRIAHGSASADMMGGLKR